MATSKQIFNDLNLIIRLNQHIEDIANSDEATAALLAKQTSFKVLAELDAIQNPDPREDAQFEHQRIRGTQDAAPSSGRELVPSQLPFHLQGDQDFNRASAIAERCALRRSELIKHKMQFLWEVARGQKKAEILRTTSLDKQLASQALGKAGTIPTAAGRNLSVIEERDYMAMMLLIFKVLRDDFVLEMAQLQVQCDWEVDSQHGKSLGFDQFFAAIFELVDLWTCDISESTYVRFLELLVRRITLRVVIFLDDMKLKLALSDNFDDAVVVKAIPLRTIQRFASVAKVVEHRGVHTVGELASADPTMIERERLDYLARNNISKEKIGAKLQHLLDTFNGLSEQLLGAGGGHGRDGAGAAVQYSLENMRLVRHPVSVDGTDAARTSSGTVLDSAALLSAATTLTSTDPNSTPVAPTTARSGVLRRLSIHDLSTTESDIINSLRLAFILEKHISIVRKHDIAGVREELEKFGVDPRGLSDNEAFEQYGGLYEMFVLRDGESIKALAKTILTQIKLELQAHGVAVDDEDAEAMYDGFYGSVVATSGEAIVKDAQKWVGEIVDTNAMASYLKADYHEFKPLEQVALIGSQTGDDEFVALLSNDGGDDGAQDQAIDSDAAADAAKSKNGSPIQRKQSQMWLKQHVPPPIQTNLRSDANHSSKRRSPKTERSAMTPPRSPTLSSGGTASPRRRSGPRIDTNAGDNLHHTPVAVHKRKKSKDREEQRSTHPLAALSQNGEHQRQRGVSDRQELEAPSLVDIVDMTEHTVDVSASAAVDASASECKDDSYTLPMIRTDEHRAPDDDDDDGARQRQSVSLKPSKSKSNLTVATLLLDLDASGTVNNGIDREAQGVEFGYEDETAPVLEPEPVLHGSAAELVPKVPKIVIGPGGAAGANIPVAARYIQLLGLGTVLTANDELGLYELLRSDEGSDVDLVCFDIGNELATAGQKLTALQQVVGKRVIVLGGDVESPVRTRAAADECVALGALYFATLPINFPVLRTEILAFFESAEQPYILRQRKATAIGGATAAIRMATRSIGAVGMFGASDLARTLSTPPAYANIAKSAKARKPTHPGSPSATALPALSPVVKDATNLIHLKALDDLRACETAPALVPSSPRSLKSYKKASPRLSVTLKKMMR